MIAALYVRVSTTEQAEEGFSIPAQSRLLTDYCNKENINIYKIYSDEGISGQKEERPAFQQMLKDAQNKCFNIILVHKFDRFARKVELSQRIKRQLRQAGVNVVSMTEPVENSPIGFFQEGIMELLSEYYVRNLAVEVKKGMIESARQGSPVGAIPYGYNKDMSINSDQAVIVKQIFDWYVNQSYGVSKIANTLNDNRIPSARNTLWGGKQIRQILSNPKYIGKIKFDGQVYNGNHETLINENTFNTAQGILLFHKENRFRHGANDDKYLLSSMIKCGECGYTMRLKKTSYKDYYICNKYFLFHEPDRKCNHSKHYHVEYVDKVVIEALTNPFTKTNVVKNIKNINDDQYMIRNREKKLIEELEVSRQAFKKGIFTEEEYLEDKRQFIIELEEIKKLKDAKIYTEEAEHIINNLMDEFNAAKSIPEQKAILKRHIDCIRIYKTGKVEIDLWY